MAEAVQEQESQAPPKETPPKEIHPPETPQAAEQSTAKKNISTAKKKPEPSKSPAVEAPKNKPVKKTKKKSKFQLDQDVVYPLQGVGKIIEQSTREFKGDSIEYYTIYINATDMTLMLPVDKVEELGLRSIVPREDAEKALKSMSDKNEPLTSDWKLRYQNNLELLKKGGIMDIATIVRSLYHRSKVKELPILERKLYDNALKLMVDEISLAMSRIKEEIEDLLHTRLENSNN